MMSDHSSSSPQEVKSTGRSDYFGSSLTDLEGSLMFTVQPNDMP